MVSADRINMMSNRYWLFSGSDYYPFGGMQDFKCSMDSVADILKILNTDPYDCIDWFQIFDMDEKSLVAMSKDQNFLDDLVKNSAKQFYYSSGDEKWIEDCGVEINK